MFAPAATLEPLTLKKSAAAASMKPGCCDLTVPYTGTLSTQDQKAVTSTLRRLMIEMRYGTRLKGVSVSAGDQVLTVTATASNFAIKQWLDSGEFIDAVDSAVRQASARY